MLLEVRGITLALDGNPVLNNLNLKVAEGTIHSVLGVNGVGKSTLASLLMGLQGLRAASGKIIFAGVDITEASVTERARLGLTLAWQAPASFEGMTVRSYLEISGRHAKHAETIAAGDSASIEQLLEMVGMDPSAYLDRYVDEHLSGGERRRIELASVVAMRPRLAILDEPDSGIDFLSLDEITGVIRRLSLQGTAVLLITHREEMALMANEASLMCAGSVLYAGEPHAVTAYYRSHCDDCKHPNLPDINGEFNGLKI